MCDIPVAVADEETVVRVVLNEIHWKKGKLRTNLFRGPGGKDEVSVMRHAHMKSDACKAKAKEIASGNPKFPYVGFAAITVESVRNTGSECHDSREGNYCGHAHISHGIPVPENEPAPPELTMRIKELLQRARLILDPAPDVQTWTGEQIETPPLAND